MFLAELPCYEGGHNAAKRCVDCEKRQSCGLELPDAVLADAHLHVVRGNVRLPKRKPETHKGDYGKVLLLGGSVGYTGAPSLCSHAAVAAGAGLVYLGVPEAIYAIEAVKNDEAMPFPLPSDENGRMAESAIGELPERCAGMDVIAAGCGFGRGEGVKAVTRRLLETWKGILVLDADALWALAEDMTLADKTEAQLVLTPHEGEFARLWPERSGDRLADARAFAETHRCTLVLKGHRTLIAFPDGEVYAIAAGNAGMARGGSGDVLTGIIAGMLGQTEFREAVVTACWLHARAGDIAAENMSEYAVTPSVMLGTLMLAQREIIEK